ncbi:MAG: hypothetical protein ACYSUK_01880 [Planctomycetota bacterium]|jgi:uncharacterized protein YxjI
MYSKHNPFKLGEDFKLYSHDGYEILTISTPKTMKEGREYKIKDTTTNESVGTITPKGIFIFREEWSFFSSKGRRMGKLVEGIISGWLHRILLLSPQRYVITSEDGRTIAQIRQHFMWWRLKYTLTICDPKPAIDNRLLIASVILTSTEDGSSIWWSAPRKR